MSKTKKIWLGILSFSPLVVTTIFMIAILLFYFRIFYGLINESLVYTDGIEYLYFMIIIIIFAFLLNIVIYTALIVFTICIVKNKKIGDTAKILYLIGMYFLYTITPIVYFFIEVAFKKDEIEEN